VSTLLTSYFQTDTPCVLLLVPWKQFKEYGQHKDARALHLHFSKLSLYRKSISNTTTIVDSTLQAPVSLFSGEESDSKIESTFSNYSPKGEDNSCNSCGRKGHTETQCHVKTTLRGQLIGSINTSTTKKITSNTSHTIQATYKRCKRCERKGHVEAQCHAETTLTGERIGGTLQDYSYCKKCGRKGHMESTCHVKKVTGEHRDSECNSSNY